MSTDLIEQLEEYFDQIEAQQSPVTTEEVSARLGTVAATRPTSGMNHRGLLVAAATAVLVLLAGIIPLLFAGEEGPTADTLDQTPTSTVAPPTTNATPSTTPLEEGFAPRLEGSGVDVTFDVTPVEMEMAGNSFVVMEADWSIDWVGMAWEWGDDEVRQRIAASSRGEDFRWLASTNTLAFVDDATGSGQTPFARFTMTFSGTGEDFEIQVHEQSSGEHLAIVTGSLPGLDEDQILERLVRPSWAPARAGWFFASDDGELTPLDPPWEPFWGAGYLEPDPFFEVGGFTLALLDVGDGLPNLWRTTDGYRWEDLGAPPWGAPYVWTVDVIAGELVVGVNDTYWITNDGVNWSEITRQDWEERTGAPPGLADIPEPPDQAILPEDEQAMIGALFVEMTANTSRISENPEILQLLPGPEPRFDTSGLGEEVEFEPLSPDDPFAISVVAEAFGDPLPGPSGSSVLVGPVTPRIGWTFGQDPMLGKAYMLFWLTLSNGMCGGSVAGGGCRGAEALGLSGANAGPIAEDDGLILVPRETSVVVLRYNADTALWQRPTGGWALFPVSVDGDDTYWIDAYDADGNLIATTETR